MALRLDRGGGMKCMGTAVHAWVCASASASASGRGGRGMCIASNQSGVKSHATGAEVVKRPLQALRQAEGGGAGRTQCASVEELTCT